VIPPPRPQPLPFELQRGLEELRGDNVVATLLLESSPQSFLGNPDCTPGYYNNEGKPMGPRERFAMSGYPEGPVAYFHYIDGWRNSGRFEGLEFR